MSERLWRASLTLMREAGPRVEMYISYETYTSAQFSSRCEMVRLALALGNRPVQAAREGVREV